MNRSVFYSTINKWPHTGAIFCGGNSSRMGRPKAGVVLPNGLTMVEHIYSVLKSICKDVVLVGHCQGVPSSLMHTVQIKDRTKNHGPLGGLEALLSSGIDSEYIISPCDIGLANGKIFELLTAEHIKPPAILSYPVYESAKRNGEKSILEIIDQPLIGRYSADLLVQVKKLISRNELAMRRLIQITDTTKVVVPEYLSKYIIDFDTPLDINILFNSN